MLGVGELRRISIGVLGVGELRRMSIGVLDGGGSETRAPALTSVPEEELFDETSAVLVDAVFNDAAIDVSPSTCDDVCASSACDDAVEDAVTAASPIKGGEEIPSAVPVTVAVPGAAFGNEGASGETERSLGGFTANFWAGAAEAGSALACGLVALLAASSIALGLKMVVASSASQSSASLACAGGWTD